MLIRRSGALTAALIVSAAIGGATPAPAATDIFIKLQGIPGSSTDARHPSEIAAQSIQFGLANTGAGPSTTGGREGKSQFSDLVFTKFLDKSSPKLMDFCLTGKPIADAQIALRKAGGQQQEFFKVRLTEVLISGYSLSSGGDLPVESVSLNFAKVEWEYFVQGPDGIMRTAAKGGWDIRMNQPTQGGAAGTIPPPTGTKLQTVLSRLSTQRMGTGVGARGLTGANIFAKITAIKGESRERTHPGEVELGSLQFGISFPATTAIGAGRSEGKATVSNISVTKLLDTASVPLMLACASGKPISKVEITFLKPGTRAEYLKVELTNVGVTSTSQAGASSAEEPTESLSLNFGKMEWSYIEQDAKGVSVPSGKVTWDINTVNR